MSEVEWFAVDVYAGLAKEGVERWKGESDGWEQRTSRANDCRNLGQRADVKRARIGKQRAGLSSEMHP